MVTIRSNHTAAPPPNNPTTGAPMAPIEQQIASAIATGFEVVLKDVRAIHREMVMAHKDMVRGAETVARRMDTAARVAPTGGLRAPSEAVGESAARRATEAHAVASMRESEPSRSTAHRASEEFLGEYKNARSVEKLRERVGGHIASGAQNYLVKPGQGLMQDNSGEWYRQGGLHYDTTKGTWHRKDGTFASGEEIAGNKVVNTPGFHKNAQGRWINSTTNRFASAGDVKAATTGLDELGSFSSRMRLSNTIGQAAEAFGSGAPVGRALMSMLPTSALKGIGYAGMAYDAVNKGYAFAQGQYAKNRRFQESLGGSNVDQFGERFSQFTNSLRGRYSLLGAENYNELFNETTKMGERGGIREASITEGARIMGGGANMQQTMSVIETARTTGQSLQGLASAIASVNKVARESMVSAAAARDVFIQNYQAISSMMAVSGSANGAKSAATAISQAVASQGAAYQGTSYTGTYSTNMQYYLAARNGMTGPQFALAQSKNPGMYQASVGAEVQRVLDSLTPAGKRSIRKIVGDYLATKGGNYVAEIDNPQIFSQILSEGYHPILIQQVLSRFGISTPDEKTAMATAVQMFTKESAGARSIEAQKATTEKYSMEGASGATPRDIRLGQTMVEGEGNKNMASRSLYSAYVKQSDSKGGQRYPVVEELLRRTKDGSLSTGAKVLVKTKDGGRVVSLADAIKNFPDQLQNGSATLLDDNLNQSVGDFLGLPAGITSGTAASASASSKAGISEDEWRKTQSKAAAKKSGQSAGDTKVTIDLTDEVKRYFKVVSAGTDTSLGNSTWDQNSANLPGVKK